MYLLVAAVGLLGLLNLLLTLAVIRRLREHTEALATTDRKPPKFKDIPLTIAPGTQVGDFLAPTTSGRTFGTGDLASPGIVAFFSMFCDSCVAKVPSFVEYVKRATNGAERTLAVVIGAPEQAEQVVMQLEPVAQVVVELPDGPVSKAFAVSGFPTFCIVGPEHTLVTSSMEMFELPDPAYV